MMKRMFWFVLGMVAGVVGVRYAKDKARQAKDDFSIESVVSDLSEQLYAAVKQAVEILRNLLEKDDAHRSSRDADVFMSGSTPNDRPSDL
jgi:hypothetical protein